MLKENIISDAECSNKLIPLDLLYGKLKEEEIIVHTEYIKEDVIKQKKKLKWKL